MTTRTVTGQCVIDAAPDVVAAAIASPHGLSSWLCDQARSEKRPDGRLSLQWFDGRQSVGRWSVYEPPGRLGWLCRDELAGPEHLVSFELSAAGGGTKVTASESDIEGSRAAELAEQWRVTLDDLKLFVERGQNGREMRQPMLGIMPEELDAETAGRLGVPVEEGMRVGGLVVDGAAGEAGLRPNDVIVAIDDAEVVDWPSLGTALRAHSAGDTVAVGFWRSREKHSLGVTLKPRPVPDVPDTIEGIRAEVVGFTDRTVARFGELFAGVDDAAAGRKSADDEWSAKEVLAHLSLGERFGTEWLLRLAGDGPPADWVGDGYDIMQRMLGRKPLGELLERYKADLFDARDVCLALLEGDLRPWVRHHIAANSHWSAMHIDDHIGQIEEALAAAK